MVADPRLTTLVKRFHKSFHKPKGLPLSFIVILIFIGESFSHGIFGDFGYNSKTLSFNIAGLYFCSFSFGLLDDVFFSPEGRVPKHFLICN